MFKRLSILTVILSGILLVGCSNQQSASTQSSSESGQTQKSKKASAKTRAQTPSTSKKTNDTKNSTVNSSSGTGSQATNNSQSTTTKQSGSTDSSSNSENNSNNDQSSQDQSSQTQQSVNLTTSDQAVEYLADKLSTTYDKTTTQYVANGKITWDDVAGYQINIYSKNSDSPVGSYLVPANGQYFQIW